VNGLQEHDGSYTRQITVYGQGLEDEAALDAATARRLAAHLLESSRFFLNPVAEQHSLCLPCCNAWEDNCYRWRGDSSRRLRRVKPDSGDADVHTGNH
jgi:hypothetical protein